MNAKSEAQTMEILSNSQEALGVKEKVISFLALFTSTGTLLCCALPASLAAIAGGSAVVGLMSTFPWLAPLSQHNGWIFLVAGVLIGFNALVSFRPKAAVACAITGGKGCEVAGSFSRIMLWTSIVVYVIGVFMSYAIVPILRLLES